METLAPSWNATLNERNCLLRSSISGFWSVDSIHAYFDGVNEAAVPLMKARKPIYALVDFTGFVPQDRATGVAIRDHLLACVKYGLKQIAIVGATPLTIMQYKRLSDGIDVQFFDDTTAASAWILKR